MIVIAFVAGLLIGWNLVPQPFWVLDIVTAIVRRFRK